MDKRELDHIMLLEQEEEIVKLRRTIVQLKNDKYNLLQHNHDLNMQLSRFRNKMIALSDENKDYQQRIQNSQNHNSGHIEFTKKLSSENQRLNTQIINLFDALQESLQQIKGLEQNLKKQFQIQENELVQKNIDYFQLQICNMKLSERLNAYKSKCAELRQEKYNLERKFQSFQKKQVIQNFRKCFTECLNIQNINDEPEFDINADRLEEQFLEDLKILISFKEEED